MKISRKTLLIKYLNHFKVGNFISLRKTHKNLRVDITNPYVQNYRIRNYLCVLDMTDFITCIDKEKSIFKIKRKIPINLDFQELIKWIINDKKVYVDKMGILLNNWTSKSELIRIHEKYKGQHDKRRQSNMERKEKIKI
jgi:hypothetical protein